MALPASEHSGVEASSGNPRFPLVDSLRGLAAAGVFVYHFAAADGSIHGVLRSVFDHGNLGVALFFLISGFLLYRPFVSARASSTPQLNPLAFYRRRALRIIPAYWMALTLLAMYPGVADFHARWWQLYLFGQIYDPNTTFAGIGPAWSLCTEVSFYLCLPLYAALTCRAFTRLEHNFALRLELALLGLLAVASALLHQMIHNSGHYANLSFTLPATFYLFAGGMALAVISVRYHGTNFGSRVAKFSSGSWLLAVALYVGVSLKINSASLGSVNPLYGFIAMLILIPAVVPTKGGVARILSNRALLWFGLVSYAFFLWHQTVIHLISENLHSQLGSLLASAAGTTLIAAASYYVVEVPWLRMKRVARDGSVAAVQPEQPGRLQHSPAMEDTEIPQ